MEREYQIRAKITRDASKLGLIFTDKFNIVMDRIVKNDGYCPCKSESPKNLCICYDVRTGKDCRCGLLKKQKEYKE